MSRIEVRTLSGAVCYIDALLDGYQQIEARNLVISVYMKFPPPRGSFWKRSFNEQVLSDQPQRFSGCDVVTCVAQELTPEHATTTSLHVTDLISLGFSLDNVDWQSFLVWSALKSVIFGDTFNHSVATLCWPSQIERLTFGTCFNQSMDRVPLPSGLRILTFFLF